MVIRKNEEKLHEAMYYEPLDNKLVRCTLCPRYCVIPPGRRGFCRCRENIDGKLYAINYGKVCSAAVDPIEKKPLYHFYPGSLTFSIATGGCNFRCKHCQNWEVSQRAPDEIIYTTLYPEDIVKMTLEYRCDGISYTYTEPTVFYELMYDTVNIARRKGLYNVMVTNGYINEEPLRNLKIDGMNIDIKGNERFYREVCSGSLEPVLRTAVLSKKMGIHVEITNLIIPTYNDNIEDILNIIHFVRDYLGRDTPLHFTRFFPRYKLLDIPPTPIEVLERARNLALEEGLKYVYIGNVPGHEGENTYCPKCGTLLIDRSKFTGIIINIDRSSGIPKCPNCGEVVDIVM
ncbi:AmmeMemoRadiSam system radical SAM enzyme [Methanofervidicoccus sp. A16]|uniref:AmmeMemoRadiSam system radical SAM enzyme n=1 Tax=Methanofervidicoccus sp. A16 TaxID=2607662 RepID=UPI00118A6769|nr:AmmeMemoRadiSam system radical SAM enzyme [Methanofervidicoccus sp. A16]AXI25143.1 AmmeMemoRadiSam system radical SAM enzyme [Methanofervidicoccus sp. A16]